MSRIRVFDLEDMQFSPTAWLFDGDEVVELRENQMLSVPAQTQHGFRKHGRRAAPARVGAWGRRPRADLPRPRARVTAVPR